MRKITFLSVIILCVNVSSCASNPNYCNPGINSFTRSVSCSMGGGYENHNNRLKKEELNISKEYSYEIENKSKLNYELSQRNTELQATNQEILHIKQKLAVLSQKIDDLLFKLDELERNNNPSLKNSVLSETIDIAESLQKLPDSAQNISSNGLMNEAVKAKSFGDKLLSTAIDIITPDITDLIPLTKPLKTVKSVLQVMSAIVDNFAQQVDENLFQALTGESGLSCGWAMLHILAGGNPAPVTVSHRPGIEPCR